MLFVDVLFNGIYDFRNLTELEPSSFITHHTFPFMTLGL